jgi:hypothetical protein
VRVVRRSARTGLLLSELRRAAATCAAVPGG